MKNKQKEKILDKFGRKFGGFFKKTSDYDVDGVKKSMEQFLSKVLDSNRKEGLKKKVFVLKRRLNYYGPFGSIKSAEEFGRWKNNEDKDWDTIGAVHKITIGELINNLKTKNE